MKASDTVILVRDENEARILKRSRLAKIYPIITLNPATETLFGQEYQIINSRQLYSNVAHIESVNRIKEGLAEFEQLTAKLPETQSEPLRNALFHVLGAVSFFYELLKNAKTCYWLENNKLRHASKEQAVHEILESLFAKNYPGLEHETSSLHRFLLKKYNAKLLKKLAGRRKMLVIGGMGRKSSRSFADEILKLDDKVVILNARSPLRNIYFFWRKMRKSLSGKDRFPIYFFYPEKTKSFAARIGDIILKTENEFLKLALSISKPYLAAIGANAAGHEISIKDNLAAISPELVISDPVGDSFTVSARKTAIESGAKVIIFNHASHSVQHEAISKTIGDLWASMGRIDSKYTTYSAIRSPAVYELVKQISPYKNQLLPVRHDKRIPAQSGKDKFTIVFAGNYLKPAQHIPWLMETPDEFMQGIEELAMAVAQIDAARLVIRIKPGKGECNIETIRQRIKPAANIELKDSGSFKNDLAMADIIVASISTTIDEALQSGRPVLLHSGPKRYFHLPAMTEVPIGKRSAVYATTKNVSLVELLKGIIAAHKDKPLSDEELAPYIWPETVPDMTELAKRILAE